MNRDDDRVPDTPEEDVRHSVQLDFAKLFARGAFACARCCATLVLGQLPPQLLVASALQRLGVVRHTEEVVEAIVEQVGKKAGLQRRGLIRHTPDA